MVSVSLSWLEPSFGRGLPPTAWNAATARLVLLEGIELSTSPLPRECSTTELQQQPAARYSRRAAYRASRGRKPGAQAGLDAAAPAPNPAAVNTPPSQADQPPPPSPPATNAAEDRRAREAAALRANLRKRKDQARARADTDAADPPPSPPSPQA